MNFLKATVFWLLSLTWGCIMSVIGLVVAFFLLITGHKPKIFGWSLHFFVGRSWGGVNLGPVIITNIGAETTQFHEHGHGLQNCLWGPLFPFVIALPSMYRYHLRNFNYESKKTYAIVMLFVILLILCLGYIPTFVFNLYWLGILISLLIIYDNIIFVWAWLVEIPKYANYQRPLYDSIWFEGQATRWGNKVFDYLKE